MNINYQKILDQTIEKIILKNYRPTLLLHSCCAPCSTYVLEYLTKYFDITVYYYNPNIFPETEFNSRFDEQKRLIDELDKENKIKLINVPYLSDEYNEAIKGLEDQIEGGTRCFECFKLRLSKSALYAKTNNFDYFTTTLTISPHKNAKEINRIGEEISREFGVEYLFSDFKKKEGYKRSIQLSDEFNLYRQDYCGCVYSKKL